MNCDFASFLSYIKQFGDNQALLDGEYAISYNELYSEVLRKVKFIESLNIQAHSTIAVLAENSIDVIELFLAVPASENVVLILPTDLDDSKLYSMIEKFDIRVIFTDRKDKLKVLDTVIVCDCSSIATEEAVLKPCAPNLPAAIFLTGGTSDELKGALHSHSSVVYASHIYVDHINTRYGSMDGYMKNKVILSLPLSHVLGMVTCVMFSLIAGCEIYVCADTKKAIKLIPRYQPNRLVLVPEMIEVLLSLAQNKKEYLASVDYILCGGAPMDPGLVDRASEYGTKIVFGYASSETAGALASNFDCELYPCSVGPVLDNFKLRIVDDELWIKCPNMMLGYYNDSELTSLAFEDGWFKTGDLGKTERHSDTDYLIITGRLKNLIILGNGENISPEELENLLNRYDEIRDCEVKEMILNGNKVVGVEIIPDGDNDSNIYGHIIDEVNRELPTYKQICTYVLREKDFEKTQAMKRIRK